MVYSSGDMELFGYATLILVGFFVCIYGSIRSILLLIEFGNEDRSVIEEEAENRKKVASTVSEIVHKMDTDFRDMLEDLNMVNDAMGLVHLLVRKPLLQHLKILTNSQAMLMVLSNSFRFFARQQKHDNDLVN